MPAGARLPPARNRSCLQARAFPPMKPLVLMKAFLTPTLVLLLAPYCLQARAFPPMKPLVLVLKAYLTATGLNDVATGGLSSYSLSNMVLAHLQEELKASVQGVGVWVCGCSIQGGLYVVVSWAADCQV